MNYKIMWITFEKMPEIEIYKSKSPELELYNIVNVIKVHYPGWRGGDADIMRCLCLLEVNKKMKIKIFQELYSLEAIESKINRWLEENPDITVLTGNLTRTAYEWYAVLWYEEEK